MIGLLLLLGCVSTLEPTTRVDDLTIVTMKLDPPRPIAGVPVALEVWVANPDDVDMEVMAWTCIPTGENSCYETEMGLAPGDRVTQLESRGANAVATIDLPPVPSDVEVDEDSVTVLIWAYACAEGFCGLRQELQARPDDPGLANILDHPLFWEDIPGFGDAAIGFRRVRVDRAPRGNANHNPNLQPLQFLTDEWVVVQADDPDFEDPVSLRAVTTSGDFHEATDGGWWFGDGRGELFIVASDDREGVDVQVLTR